MSDRDELVQLCWQAAGYESSIREVEEAADAILAAGWTKRRAVTTVEELDALPVGSVAASCKVHELPGGHVYPLSYQRLYTGDWHRGGRSGESRPEYILPATVLYTPGADQ